MTAAVKALAEHAGAQKWPLMYQNIADEPAGIDSITAADDMAAAIATAGLVCSPFGCFFL